MSVIINFPVRVRSATAGELTAHPGAHFRVCSLDHKRGTIKRLGLDIPVTVRPANAEGVDRLYSSGRNTPGLGPWKQIAGCCVVFEGAVGDDIHGDGDGRRRYRDGCLDVGSDCGDDGALFDQYQSAKCTARDREKKQEKH